jgi:hypothetical protein
MKKSILCLLLIGMMSQITPAVARPIRPHGIQTKQAASARLGVTKAVPPIPPNHHL